jgi:ankyrin repeat protein
MKILLSYKADPNQKDIDLKTPLDLAIFYRPLNYSDIIFTLVLHRADFNTEELEEDEDLLFIAIERRHTPLAKILIENKMNINITTRRKNTALSYSIYNRNLKITEMLLRKRAKLNLDDLDYNFQISISNEEEDYLMDKLLRKYGVSRVRYRWY